MDKRPMWRAFAATLLLGLLLAGLFVLPDYHLGQFSRVMVLAIFAMGYNLLYGYTGLLSLGHALFFAAGLYGFGLAMHHSDLGFLASLAMGVAAPLVLALVLGGLWLRTRGVAFIIVTLMFAQAGYLSILYFADITFADQGFVLAQVERQFLGLDVTQSAARYAIALTLLALALTAMFFIVSSRFGKELSAIRENPERASLLGINTQRHRYIALAISALFAGLAGATFAWLFGYVGASFASVQYSIFPLLWVLVGGAGTLLGPIFGTLFMVYLVDFASELTDAYMLVVGGALILVVMFARQGLVGLALKVLRRMRSQ